MRRRGEVEAALPSSLRGAAPTSSLLPPPGELERTRPPIPRAALERVKRSGRVSHRSPRDGYGDRSRGIVTRLRHAQGAVAGAVLRGPSPRASGSWLSGRRANPRSPRPSPARPSRPAPAGLAALRGAVRFVGRGEGRGGARQSFPGAAPTCSVWPLRGAPQHVHQASSYESRALSIGRECRATG